MGGTLSGLRPWSPLPLSPPPLSRLVSRVTTRAQWAGRGKGASRGGACGGSGVPTIGAGRAPEMLRARWLRLCTALCSLLLGQAQAQAPSPGVPPERSRPYAVLRGQNLGERGGAEAARVYSLSRAPRACQGFGELSWFGELSSRWSSRSRFSCCQPQAWEAALVPCVLAAPAGTGSRGPWFVRSCRCAHVGLCGFRLGSRAHPAGIPLPAR